MNVMKKFLLIILLGYINQINAQGCFNSATTYSTISSPYTICNADFNGDGKIDLVTANPYSNNVSLFLGTGTGTFSSPTNFTVAAANSAYGVISADFNGDSKADLAVTIGNDISILLGTGTGSFGAPINSAVSTYYSIISDDFNTDGKVDIAVADGSKVSVLLGTGTGSFGAATTYTFAANTWPQSLTSADLNGDGKVDLAVANNQSNNVSILLGSGTGSFSTATNFATGSAPSFISHYDFNGDTYMDLVTANNNALVSGIYDSVSVLLGTGTGSFNPALNFVTDGGSCSIVINDLNGDGKVDLAIANSATSDISILLGTGTGSFNTTTNYIVVSNPTSITSADFNGDGNIDLATADLGISVLLNNPAPSISINSTASNICPGSSSTLTASGATSYSWSTSATTATISVSPTVTTSYSVTGGSGCGNTAVATINVIAPATPNICMVTTDSASNYNYNMIVWNKTLYSYADSFIVYRYDVISSSYLRIGAVSKNSLSEFRDTAFSVGGPNGGNPLYSSWQYKLAIRDTCGNIGQMSLYHQSMFVQQSGSTFSWNAYTVEGGSSPVTGYSFLRDDNNTGAWHVLVNTAGLSTTDPNYASYPSGNWRVDALGFNCTPTMLLGNSNNTSSVNKKSHSNTSKPTITGINQIASTDIHMTIYPNPTSDQFFIDANTTDKLNVDLYDVNGRHLFSKNVSDKSSIDVTYLNEGIYTLTIKTADRVTNKKLVILR